MRWSADRTRGQDGGQGVAATNNRLQEKRGRPCFGRNLARRLRTPDPYRGAAQTHSSVRKLNQLTRTRGCSPRAITSLLIT